MGLTKVTPIAPLLFSCGEKKALEEFEQNLRDEAERRGACRQTVQVMAYLDDVVAIVPPCIASVVGAIADRVIGTAGLTLEQSKAQAWSPTCPCPEGLERHWQPHGLTLVGVPLGGEFPDAGLPDDTDERRVDMGSHCFVEARCLEVAGRAANLLQRLADLPASASAHLPAVQAASLLLRMCGAGKITHLLRSNPPEATKQAAAHFDRELLQTYEAIADLDPLSGEQASQCQLPLRLGGRGLRSQESIAAAAWVGSWAQCLVEVHSRTSLLTLADLETSELLLAHSLRTAVGSLPAARSTDEDIPTWSQLATEPHLKVQKVLTQRIETTNHSSLLKSLDRDGCARLRSCGGPFAAGWQSASPGVTSERMDDVEYALTARCFLGRAGRLGPRPASASVPAAPNEDSDALRQSAARHTTPSVARSEAVPSSAAGWSKTASKASTASVVSTWTARSQCQSGIASSGGALARIACRKECSSPPPGGPCSSCGSAIAYDRVEAILDLEIQGPEVPRLFFDVTVRHGVPGCTTRSQLAATANGTVNSEAEADKKERYPGHRCPWRMVPFAVETYGRMGTSALRHLRKLARSQAAGFDGQERTVTASLLSRWGSRISVALHRANVRNVRRSLGWHSMLPYVHAGWADALAD